MTQRLRTDREALGASHPAVATTLDDLASLYGAAGNSETALAFSRKATAAIIAHAAAEASGAQQPETRSGLVEQRASYFRRHVANLALAAGPGGERGPALGGEALEVAQWASHSSAAAGASSISAA